MKGYCPRAAALVVATVTLALAGCSSTADTGDEFSIVASTDVYADIASEIAGDRASVTAIISGASQDPHSYEATARDQLALSRADLVVENGGGFDPFIDVMLESLQGPAPLVLTATEIAGHAEGDEHGHEEHEHEHEHAGDDQEHDHAHGANEHVWYSFEAMDALAAELAHHLSELDPDGAGTYEQNHEAFSSGVAELRDRADGMRAEHEGSRIAVTEAAPLMLFEQIGLSNETPPEFSSAIENGSDVAPSVLLEMQRLVEGGTLALLAYNEQTAGPETQQVLALAESAGVPIVPVAETLPEGVGYLEWMSAVLDDVADALA